VRKLFISLLLLTSLALAQDKVFGWLAGTPQSYQLELGRWQAIGNYNPGPIHLRINVQASNSIAMALMRASDWNAAQGDSEELRRADLICPAQGIVQSTYTCNLDSVTEPMVLVVHDDRSAGDAIGRALHRGMRAAAEGMVEHTEATFTPMHWGCVQNCYGPQYAWFNVVHEKFQIMPLAKTYGPLTPDMDDQQVSVKVKSPVPMLVAILPVATADRLRANPSQADALLEGVACKQRAVQSTQFTCKLYLRDGTQQVVLMPEPGVEVKKKKANIDVLAMRCTVNCAEIEKPQRQEARDDRRDDR
jgi:hypothetical protein